MFSRTARFSLSFLIVALVTNSLSAAPQSQVQFFDHIEANDTAALLSSMGSELREEIDEPVFAAWVAGFRKELGSVRKIKRYGWASNLTLNGLMSESKCTVTCERGTADSRLTMLNGKIVGFNVQSDRLSDWFEGLPSTELYETMGASFIERFFSGSPEAAHGMCHPALQDSVSLQQLKDMVADVKGQTGTPVRTRVSNVSVESTKRGDCLFVVYTIDGVESSIKCRIKIQFVGLKGHLLGFRFFNE